MPKDREDLCKKVIGVAAKILSDEGPDALTVRRIAQESGASTQLVYTLFGGKFGLIDGLYKEGFIRLADFMASRQNTQDPKKNLENLLHAYREFSVKNKPFFIVMFTRPVPEYTPPPESLRMAWSSFETLVKAIERVQPLGHLKGDAKFIARELWSQAHGVVTLEMIGHLWDRAGDRIYDEMINRLWAPNS
ncbi:MAG: TetR/AcrR family transcriptional regulator [Bdellovibrio sp.]